MRAVQRGSRLGEWTDGDAGPTYARRAGCVPPPIGPLGRNAILAHASARPSPQTGGLEPFGYGGAVAEVVETRDLTASSQDGWAVDYRIRRDDGEELHAEVRCWQKAHAAADRAANAEALAAIADRGRTAALEYSELVESPATRGAVVISIWFDPVDDGTLRRRVSYERTPE